jgi:hypothetical protein
VEIEMPKVIKIDLSLLKQLVGELENALTTAESIKSDDAASNHNNDYIVEMAKSAGLCAGIAEESAMLVMDIRSVVRASQMPTSKGDPLEKLLGVLKGGGGLGGTN